MEKKIIKKQQAIELRKKGFSVNKIANDLSVSKSSVSVWVRNVILSSEQKTQLRDRENAGIATKVWVEQRRKIRLKYQQEGWDKSKEKDWEHAFACSLYYGEGHKTGNCLVAITNCDVDLLIFFVNFLRGYFKVESRRISFNFCCYLGNGLSIEQIRNYWCKKLKLPIKCAKKPIVKEANGKNPKYPYGICKAYTSDVKIFQHIKGAIKGYLGKDKSSLN